MVNELVTDKAVGASSLTAATLVKDPALSQFSGHVSDSSEGRWTIDAAIDEAVPVPVLSAALYQRFSSRGQADYQNRILSANALRIQRTSGEGCSEMTSEKAARLRRLRDGISRLPVDGFCTSTPCYWPTARRCQSYERTG